MKGPEYQLQSQVAQLAHLLGWETIAWRPAMTKHGWRTPGTGSMASGWPDMILVRARDRRIIIAELKSDVGTVSPDQRRILSLLREVATADRLHVEGTPRIEVFVWRPRDWEAIEATLR